MRCPAAPSARLSCFGCLSPAGYGSRPGSDPGPGLGPAPPTALLYLGGGGSALRAGEGAVARDRPEGVQHQRLQPPPPGGPSCPQPLRGSGCHGERGHWAVCTPGETMAGRETFGPGMQARERPRLGMEAHDKHTQTKDWLSVRALASGVSGVGCFLSWARRKRACWTPEPRCCLGRPKEESVQGEGVTSCLQGWEGERSFV